MRSADEEQMCGVCVCVCGGGGGNRWRLRCGARTFEWVVDMMTYTLTYAHARCLVFCATQCFFPLHFAVSNVMVQRYLCSHELDEETSAPWDWMRCAEEGRARERRVDHPQGHAKRGKCRCSKGVTLDIVADATLRASRVTLQKLDANSADMAKL